MVSTQRLIYGCMGLGGGWTGDPITATDQEVATAAIDAALAAGIRAFDHADIYKSGKAETVFGRYLKDHPGLRKDIWIQTKASIRLREVDGLPIYYDTTPASLRERLEGSLERLGVDYVDSLLIHRLDPLTAPAETAAGLEALCKQGLVRSVGVSNMGQAQMAALQRHLSVPLRYNQLEISLAKRDWLESGVLENQEAGKAYSFPAGTMDYCVEHGVEVQAWASLARGRYTGAANDGEGDQGARQLVAQMAARLGVGAEAVVLGWLMRHPAAISPVIGTVNPARIAACADAAKVAASLTRQDWYRLWTAARGAGLP